jgi:hypothetical protein
VADDVDGDKNGDAGTGGGIKMRCRVVFSMVQSAISTSNLAFSPVPLYALDRLVTQR